MTPKERFKLAHRAVRLALPKADVRRRVHLAAKACGIDAKDPIDKWRKTGVLERLQRCHKEVVKAYEYGLEHEALLTEEKACALHAFVNEWKYREAKHKVKRKLTDARHKVNYHRGCASSILAALNQDQRMGYTDINDLINRRCEVSPMFAYYRANGYSVIGYHAWRREQERSQP